MDPTRSGPRELTTWEVQFWGPSFCRKGGASNCTIVPPSFISTKVWLLFTRLVVYLSCHVFILYFAKSFFFHGTHNDMNAFVNNGMVFFPMLRTPLFGKASYIKGAGPSTPRVQIESPPWSRGCSHPHPPKCDGQSGWVLLKCITKLAIWIFF